MTLAQIIASVRRLLQDDEYDADTIMEAANWFVYELFNNNHTRLMEQSITLEPGAGDLAINFPDDMMAWTTMYLTSPQIYDLTNYYKEYGDFMKAHANFATATAGQPRYWTDFGNAIRFAQPLSVDAVINVDYVRAPKAMVANSSKCEVPARYAELVAKGTKARIMEIDEDYQEANQERALLAPLVTTFIRNEARGGGKTKPTIMRTNRRSIGSGRRMGE